MSVSLDPDVGNAGTGSVHASRLVAAAYRVALRDVALACLLSALVLAPTALELAASWQGNEAYQYAWLVVPMFVYLLGWHHRALLLGTSPRPDAAGIIVALVASIGWSVAAAANIDIGRQLALIMVLQAITLAALGRALYRRLLPLMGLLLLMLPSGDLLLGPLRWMTTQSIVWFARASGLPYLVEGFSIRIGENTYFVLDACSGLAQVTLTFFLGYCFALLVFNSFVKILALALFSASLGVLANVIRVIAIVWLDWTRGYAMDLTAHVRIQWAALLVVMALLFYALIRIRGDGGPSCLHAETADRLRVSRLSRHAPVAAGVVVLVITGLASALLKEVPLASAALFPVQPPVAIQGWELVTPGVEWSPQGEVRVLTLSYGKNDRRLGVTLVEKRVPGAKLLPERVRPIEPAGWRDSVRESVDACSGAYCVTLVHEVWQDDEERARRHVYYAYSLGRFQTHSTLALRLATALSRLSGSDVPARLLAISAEGDAPGLDELATIYRAIDDAARNARV